MTVGTSIALESPWAVIWLSPLLLRFISAFFALDREPLIPLTSSSAANDPHCDFEIHCPQSEGRFALFSGPPTVVLQFARPYGHPKRNRFREIVQLTVITLFACLFPFELLCSMIWMPVMVQNVWLCYQLHVVLAMHYIRYSRFGTGPTTEVVIARKLEKEMSGSGKTGGRTEQVILFGYTRQGPGTVKVSLLTLVATLGLVPLHFRSHTDLGAQ